jgi:hypothetical protein
VTILDTSFLFSLTNKNDRTHRRSVALQSKLERPILLPMPVLTELCYLLASKLGHHVMRHFLRLLQDSNMQLVSLNNEEIQRVAMLLDQYADTRLDFADAAIVAIAERYGVTKIATYDRRDFSMIRPRHVAFFELLP